MTEESADLPTPALVVDLPAFDKNVGHAARLAADHGKLLRPHVKTHRTPALAARQLGTATCGVTCATVGEAEAMESVGIDDLLIANEIVTREKIARVVALAERTRVTIAVDDRGVAATISAAASSRSQVVRALIDVDVGLHRCGVRDVQEALELAAAIEPLKGLGLDGLMGYEGRVRASREDRAAEVTKSFTALTAVKTAMQRTGFDVRVVSASGTSTLPEALACPAVTEIQAGTYALMEHDLDGLGLPFSCAAVVDATVISRSDRLAVVDAGRKSIGCEYGPPKPLRDGWRVVALSEEHSVIDCGDPAPPIGARVALRPSQIRTTFNLHDRVWLKDSDGGLQQVLVSARGASD